MSTEFQEIKWYCEEILKLISEFEFLKPHDFEGRKTLKGWIRTKLKSAQPYFKTASESEWQPIETAPKTGQCLCWNGVSAYIMFKMDGEWKELVTLMTLRRPPTHWLPVPKPPETI